MFYGRAFSQLLFISMQFMQVKFSADCSLMLVKAVLNFPFMGHNSETQREQISLHCPCVAFWEIRRLQVTLTLETGAGNGRGDIYIPSSF